MADRINIKLHVCDKPYELTITPDKEEVYRLAEGKIKELVAKYGKAQFKEFTLQDCLALATLEFAIENITMSQSREVGNDDVKELNAISDKISEYMNRLGER